MDASPRDTKPGRSRSRSAAKRPDRAPGAPAAPADPAGRDGMASGTPAADPASASGAGVVAGSTDHVTEDAASPDSTDVADGAAGSADLEGADVAGDAGGPGAVRAGGVADPGGTLSPEGADRPDDAVSQGREAGPGEIGGAGGAAGAGGMARRLRVRRPVSREAGPRRRGRGGPGPWRGARTRKRQLPPAGGAFARLTVLPAVLVTAWLVPGLPLLLAGVFSPTVMLLISVPLAIIASSPPGCAGCLFNGLLRCRAPGGGAAGPPGSGWLARPWSPSGSACGSRRSTR